MAGIHPSHLSEIAPEAIGMLFERINHTERGPGFLSFVVQWLRSFSGGAGDIWHRYIIRNHADAVQAAMLACAQSPLPQQITDLVG